LSGKADLQIRVEASKEGCNPIQIEKTTMSVAKSALFRHGSNILLLAALAAGMMTVAVAQSDGPPPPHPGMPPQDMMRGPMGDMLHADMADWKQVKGAPLTADLVVTRDTVLANGTHIHNASQTKVYRDGEGRTRREIGFEINTPATGSVRRTMIVLVDPVSGNRYMLNPANKVARQMPIHHGRPDGHRGHGAEGLGEGAPPPGKSGADIVKTEQLGTKTINGLQAEGTRVTRTIAAGDIGNDAPIDVVTERWVSVDLQVPLLVTHSDPMMGTVTSTLTNITRSEPEASLFVVPADYKIESGRQSDPFYVPKP
jgi:hypothetical protein